MFDVHNDTINFIDLETTGTNYRRDRVIEVYASKYKGGEKVGEFHSYVNPNRYVEKFIQQMTQITPELLKEAPSFQQIANDLEAFLSDGVLLAHNARFDYTFLKHEFKRSGKDFESDYCCTLKLSKFLYPQYRRHGVDALAARLNLGLSKRHSAKFDTNVIEQFFFESVKNKTEEDFAKALKTTLSKSSIPQRLLKYNFDEVPKGPGVYIFYGENNIPLYVGKSISLKKRIKSHLYNDLRDTKEQKITSQIADIQTVPTAGELGALIRESFYVKKLMPLYNYKLRHNRALLKVKKELSPEGYFVTRMVREPLLSPEEFDSTVAVFRNFKHAQFVMESFVKTHGLCSKLLGLQSTKGACFSYHLKQCKGACVGNISPEEYNSLFDSVFENMRFARWPFDGPIAIHEEHEDKQETLYFDNWVFTGSTDLKPETEDIQTASFNLDVYHILSSHLKKDNIALELIKSK